MNTLPLQTNPTSYFVILSKISSNNMADVQHSEMGSKLALLNVGPGITRVYPEVSGLAAWSEN
jgi:hypothetical protein